jgi:AraC-like DNA-binding protein
MQTAYKVPVNSTGKILNAASAAGIKREDFARAAGFDLRLLEHSNNEIPFTQLFGLYRQAANLTGDDAFGLHVGERDSPKSYGILGYLTINSRTVGEALKRLVRFQRIRTDGYRFSLEISGANARLAYIYQANEVSSEERRHEAEETLCSIIDFGRSLTGFEWRLREVHFEHARPNKTCEHERIFCALVCFGKPFTQIVFDSSYFNLPLTEADLTLGSLLERQAEELLAKSPQDEKTFVSQIRPLITENLSGGEQIRMETICRKLGSSKRTLQRKLMEEGITYQKLLEETQFEMSKSYLRKPEITICEISDLLGFSEPSAFHRAFRRWTGLTPKEFQHLQNQETGK